MAAIATGDAIMCHLNWEGNNRARRAIANERKVLRSKCHIFVANPKSAAFWISEKSEFHKIFIREPSGIVVRLTPQWFRNVVNSAANSESTAAQAAVQVLCRELYNTGSGTAPWVISRERITAMQN